MEPEPKRRFRLILDFKSQFPEKLFDVANDGFMIQWNRDDSVSIKNEEEFEQNVMKLYPGFLQIPSILNLKRLFREYGFERDIGPNGLLKFSHPCFQRGRRELLSEIRTRRKSFRTPQYLKSENSNESLVIDTEDGRRYSTRRRRRTYRYNESPVKRASFTPGKTDKGGCGDFSKSPAVYCIPNPMGKPNNNVYGYSDVQRRIQAAHSAQLPNTTINGKRTSRTDLHNVMDRFATNEFSEQEYNDWLIKKRKMDESKSSVVEIKTPEQSKDFWWMYEDQPAVNTANNKNTANESTNQETCMPCGFCKCCSAISNYVHIFGEVPENIQVYDFVEEVFEAEDQASDNVALKQESENIIDITF